MELAVIGGNEFTLGFMMSGIKEIHEVENGNQAEKAVRNVMENKNIGIMIIDGQTMNSLDERIQEEVEMSVNPVAVVLSTEASQEALRKMIIKSIGIDLWKD